jgi:two-component sensor histidine kinase
MTKRNITLNEKILEPALHVLGWVLVFGSPFLFMDSSMVHTSLKFLNHIFLAPAVIAFMFYASYFILVPRYWQKGKIETFLVLSLALTVVCLLVMQTGYNPKPATDMPVAENTRPPRPLAPRWMFVMRDFILLTLATTAGAVTRQSKLVRKTEMERREAEMQRQEAELRNLHNQINPHFLLNTLNNIYALIAINTDKAQEAVQQLSVLLRHILYENKDTFVPLESELQFIRNYIELMRIRLSSHVTLNVEIEDDKYGLSIAPLIFISLIENAFKHGVSSGCDCFISISLKSNADGCVVCRIENSNHPKTHNDKSGHGIGLQQVQQRLDLLYPGAYRWTKGVTEAPSRYRSHLVIETQRNTQHKISNE